MVRPVEVRHSAALGLLKVIRRDAGSLDLWLSDVLQAASRVFPEVSHPSVLLLAREPEQLRCEHLIGPHWPSTLLDAGKAAWALIPPSVLDGIRREGRVLQSGVDVVAGVPAGRDELFDGFVSAFGGLDALGLLAHAGSHTFTFSGVLDRRIRVSRSDEALAERISLHIEAALTLHTQPRSVVAVLRPDGRVLHAEGAGEPRSTRDVLSAHIAQVELQRGARRRDDDAIDGWTALCEGRFALLERESGGRREYVVLESGPHAFERRALDATEARALELSARGQPNKTVAYALGISAAGVSRALASAAHKLGLSSGAELVRLAAGVVGPSSLMQVSLTPVEREIVEMLKLGWSNATIGKARGRSERTVANQIAALLRKTGAASRRGLAGL